MSQEMVTQIAALLAPARDICLAILYGSRAAGRPRPGSDADVAVAACRALSLERRMALAVLLEEGLGCPVDLIDLVAVEGTVLTEALTKGRLVLCRDHKVYAAAIKRMWYQEADFMPQYRAGLAARRRRFLDGPQRP